MLARKALRTSTCTSLRNGVAPFRGDRCTAEFRSGLCPLGVKLGHSAMSAQCPVCPKADTAERFMSRGKQNTGNERNNPMPTIRAFVRFSAFLRRSDTQPEEKFVHRSESAIIGAALWGHCIVSRRHAVQQTA